MQHNGFDALESLKPILQLIRGVANSHAGAQKIQLKSLDRFTGSWDRGRNCILGFRPIKINFLERLYKRCTTAQITLFYDCYRCSCANSVGPSPIPGLKTTIEVGKGAEPEACSLSLAAMNFTRRFRKRISFAFMQ